MPKQTEIVAIIAGVLIIAGGVAMELAGKAAPAEVWVAGTAALSGGLGLAIPSSAGSSALASAASDLSKLAGYLSDKAPPPAAGPQSAPAATGTEPGPVSVAKSDTPSATEIPTPATLSPDDAPAAAAGVTVQSP